MTITTPDTPSTEPENIEDYFIDKVAFSRQVEQVVQLSNGEISFIDAAISIAEIHQIDLMDISKFIMPRVKQRIRMEAIESRLLRNDDDSGTALNTFLQ